MEIKDMNNLYPSPKLGTTFTCKIVGFKYNGKWLTLNLLEMHFKENIEFTDKVDKIWNSIKCNCPQNPIRKRVKEREHKQRCLLATNISHQTKEVIRKELKDHFNGFEHTDGHWVYSDPWSGNQPHCEDYNLDNKFIQLHFDGSNWEIVQIKESKRCVFD